MSKIALNLSLDTKTKKRAKELAKKRGVSISRFFEQLIIEHEHKSYVPPANSGTEQFVNAIPDKDKVIDYDYKALKSEALQNRK